MAPFQPEPLSAEPVVRVLLVASSLVLQVMQQMLHSAAGIEVCGVAKHGREALALLPILRPQVICVSDQMATMSALELTREVMMHHACPILVLQGSAALPCATIQESVFELLQAGAVDVCALSTIVPAADSRQTRQLISKIKMVARVPVISRSQRAYAAPNSLSTAPEIRPRGSAPDAASALATATEVRRPRTISLPASASNGVSGSLSGSTSRIVAIGASTGGPQALLAVLTALPRNYPFPILCVQHISKGFIGGLVEWLDGQCQVKVKIAYAGEKPLPGVVYFAEEDKHLELDENGAIRLSISPAVDGHRPSATVLFQSVARQSGGRAVAVLLTGMGRDGAQGLKAVHEARGLTFAQNQESCVVFGMPAAAIEMGAAQHVLPPAGIAEQLLGLAASRGS